MWWKRKNSLVFVFFIAGIVAWAGVFISASDKDELPEALPMAASSKKGYKIKSYPIPENLTFAGENIPIQRFDVKEKFDRELVSNVYFHSNTILLIKRANRYFPIIEPILKANNIPEDFKYIAMIESGFQPRVVSPAGAAGIWQFLKATGREYGLEVNTYVDERYNVEKATEAACKYLQSGYDKFGSWSLTAASYNIGKTRIANEVERQNCGSYFDLLLPEETSRYVFRALALKQIMEGPANYGFTIHEQDLYPPLPCKEIVITTPITDMVEFASQHQTSYYMLKEFNPWLRDTYLTNASGKAYVIKLPDNAQLNVDPDHIKVHNKNWVIHD